MRPFGLRRKNSASSAPITTGNSTKEIAALLFLSPRTIEHHLHKVFTKLGISSRTDLIRLIMRNASIIEG
jgi:DNA-binding NarL/FixJ family response regulator